MQDIHHQCHNFHIVIQLHMSFFRASKCSCNFYFRSWLPSWAVGINFTGKHSRNVQRVGRATVEGNPLRKASCWWFTVSALHFTSLHFISLYFTSLYLMRLLHFSYYHRWEYPQQPDPLSDTYVANYNAPGCQQVCKLPPGQSFCVY